MIKFWLKSKDNLIYYYNFRDIALDGVLSVDKDLNVKLVSAEGEFADDEDSINKVLRIAKKEIEENGFLDEFIYAWC